MLSYNQHMEEERPLITSLSNPLAKNIRALKGRKARAESGLFLVEGLHHVGSALEAEWNIDVLLYAPDLLTGDFAKSLLDNTRHIGVAPQPVSATVMESLAEKDHPQGILAVVKQRKMGFGDLRETQSGVALISPQDPGNVGTILRTLDAVGADVLFLLDGGVELYHPTCVRASMGTIFWKPVVRASFEEFLDWVKDNGIHLIGASAHAQVDYHEIPPNGSPWILLLGSEQKGLSDEQIAGCDVTVSMPMRGKVSSLNLSVAAGILLYALKA
jgi:TrmH family RNA methyltransferase